MSEHQARQSILRRMASLPEAPAFFVFVALGVWVLASLASDIARLLGWSDVQNSVPAGLTLSLVIGRLLGGSAACIGVYYLYLYLPWKRGTKGENGWGNAQQWVDRHPVWASVIAGVLLVLVAVPAWNNLAERGQYRAYWSGYEYLASNRHSDDHEARVWLEEIARKGVAVPSIAERTEGQLSGTEPFWFWQLGVAEGYSPYQLPEATGEEALPLYLAIVTLSAARELARAVFLLMVALVLSVVYLILGRDKAQGQ